MKLKTLMKGLLYVPNSISFYLGFPAFFTLTICPRMKCWVQGEVRGQIHSYLSCSAYCAGTEVWSIARAKSSLQNLTARHRHVPAQQPFLRRFKTAILFNLRTKLWDVHHTTTIASPWVILKNNKTNQSCNYSDLQFTSWCSVCIVQCVISVIAIWFLYCWKCNYWTTVVQHNPSYRNLTVLRLW